MNASYISSAILINDFIIAKIYSIIKGAGLAATKTGDVISKKNDVCIIQSNQPGMTRKSGCHKSTDYYIEYNSNDLVVVGGAALNLYDFKLRQFKGRHKMGGLETFVKKTTSDIDIVWWPHSVKDMSGRNTSDIIVTSQSGAIQILADVFVYILDQKMNENMDTLYNFFNEAVKPYSIDTFSHNISKKNIEAPGVISITIEFNINNINVKLCDISIHDSGSSQLFNRTGQYINTLLPMSDDLLYVTSNPVPRNDINNTYIAVPNILLFIYQQMFASNNMKRRGNIEKSSINFKRILYIKELLSRFTNNEQNIRNLQNIFGITNTNTTKNIISKINSHTDISTLEFKINEIDDISSLSTSVILQFPNVNILKIYSPAPAYLPPVPPIQNIYYEPKSNRRLKWLVNQTGRIGHWFYLDPPPLPPGPPQGKPPLHPGSRRQGGIRNKRNKTHKKLDLLNTNF
jgi:hypothetical protein